MANAVSHAFLERYNQLKILEGSKNELIEDLLQRITELEDAYHREKLDHERETRFNRDIQIHEMELMDQISRMRAIMDREPFVIVLLDGDGMIFKDHFLQQGVVGGHKAAQQLSDALHGYISTTFPSIDSPKIMAHLYINVKGFKDLCTRAGIVDDPSLIEDFVRGFNTSIALFDIVDIGVENETTDKKIAEMFPLYLYNCQCHQILIGCSRDFNCAQFLNHTTQVDRDLTGRVSLVEGVPFEKDFEVIKQSYRVTKFPEIFRDTKIAVSTPWRSAAALRPQPVLTPSPSQEVALLARTSTSTTVSATNGLSMSAKVNGPDSEPEFKAITTKDGSSPSSAKTVPRNKYGQRVDKLDFKTIPREELNRVKKLKLCNLHFLLGECPNDNCYHDHSYKLSKNEKFVLHAIARMTPCHYGLECDDPECIYGHRCPQSEPGRKDCYWGSNCRFDESAHGIDTNVVRVTKV